MAVEFRSYKYTSTGTEIDFLQGFIDLVNGLDDDITCVDENGDPVTAAQILGEGGTAYFYVDFNNSNAPTIKFARERGIGSGAHLYGLYVNNEYWKSLVFSYDDYGVGVQTPRSWEITLLKGESVVGLWIGSYAATSVSNSDCSFMRIKTTNDNYFAVLNTINIMTATFYSSDSSATFKTILPYNAGAGNIDYVQYAIFESGGTRAAVIEDIYSCSNVTAWSTIALPNGKNYVAVHTNAMIELTNDESE